MQVDGPESHPPTPPPPPTSPAAATAAGGEAPKPAPAPATTKETVKETFVSIIIAFVLAFVFRGFVVEAFVIPTGSMAPTLMGAHMRFRGPESGYSWPVGPWYMSGQNEYFPIQGDSRSPIVVHDPMTGQRVEQAGVRRRAGDRILVLKFLYGIFGPSRFDVVVFKDPTNPQTNFIKRLIGLPGEEVALVDGDVFVRTAEARAAAVAEAQTDLWSQPGWAIARKPTRVQGAVWQEVFDSRYAPLNPMRDGRMWYQTPWVPGSGKPGEGGASGWSIDGKRIYEYTGAGPTTLRWDRTRTRYIETAPPWNRTLETWEIDDRYPYNESPHGHPGWSRRFPVSDVRMRAGIEPGGEGLAVTATVASRGHEFQAELDRASGRVTLRMRRVSGAGGEGAEEAGAWTELGTGALPGSALAAGRVTDVEFWHVDQSVQVWVDGRRAVYAEYNWTPAERIRYATGHEIGELLTRRNMDNVFEDATLYTRPTVRWEFSGGPLRLHRVGLDRDLHYQPTRYHHGLRANDPALATHPDSTPRLSPEEYFTLGDNSPASQDGRLWDDPDPWVAKQMWKDKGLEPKAGVVPRELMIGKAFFVYFPSLHRDTSVPVPDFGRLRFIW